MENQNCIENLNERRSFWNAHHVKNCQGSTPVHVDLIKKYCMMNNVLEIGPGEGRQFDIGFPISRTYDIADISNVVLNRDKYDNVGNKYFIQNYNDVDFKRKYDVVHCWYVLHHVLREETISFINMAYRLLIEGGIFMFNFANFRNDGKDNDNGTQTTRRTFDEVISTLEVLKFRILEYIPVQNYSSTIVSVKVK